jgi:hypothetical protein
MKFKTKEELVDWIETMHLQNTNGRETELEMFRLGIEATIEEITDLGLFSKIRIATIGSSDKFETCYYVQE